MQENVLELAAKKYKNNEEVALVTITNTEGSSPLGIGSMMLVDSEGVILGGTIGGGEIEEKARLDAQACLKAGESKKISYGLNLRTGPDNLSMTCGGNVEVFITVFKNADQIIIVGAGHVGLSLYKFAKLLGYAVTIIDDREEFLTKERFPEADRLMPGDIPTELGRCRIDERTSIVIITHGHLFDEAALEAVITSPARYIGMIGSRKKISAVYHNLEKRGIPRESFERVYSPIGLDLGGERREEVALAIIAEIQAVKYGRDGRPLSQNMPVI